MRLATRAAVLRAIGSPLEVEELDLEGPGPGEVLLRIEASGVCHSDWNAVSGASPTPMPAVLGHEGAGVVEETGAGVTSVSAGDRVALSWLPHCGQCRQCMSGRVSLCERAGAGMAAGTLPGGAIRLSSGGEPVHHYSYLSTFAGHAVVAESSCIAIPVGVPPEVAALVGCAVLTGYGAVVRRAQVFAGSSVLVMGAGGVGLSAIMAARLSGAETILAVDPFPSKRALALELGATATLDSADPDLLGSIRSLSAGGGGVDFAFEAAGVPSCAELAFAATRPGGTIVAVGIPPAGATVALPGQELVRSEKVVTGTFYGSTRPPVDIPLILGLYRDGRLPLDRLVTRRYALDEVNSAFADMNEGRVARGVLLPWGDKEERP